MDAATFDLNTASAVELCAECPRLGLFLAEDIVAWRNRSGPFTDTASVAALVEDKEVLAELVVGLSTTAPRTEDATEPSAHTDDHETFFRGLVELPRRKTLIDGAPPEAASAHRVEGALLDVDTTSASAAPVDFMDPWAPPESAPTSGNAAPPSVVSEDGVCTSAPSEDTRESDDTRSSQPAPERISGFRARLAAARALAESVKAANAAATSEDVDAAIVADPTPAVEAEAAPVVEAVSQTMPIEPSAPLPPAAAPAATRVEHPARRRVSVHAIALIGVVLANAGLGFGLANLHHDERRGRVPVAAISAEVKLMQSTQAATAAELEHTRRRLDEHEATLAKTIEKVNAVAQHHADVERAAKERADGEAKELAAMNARVNRMERRVDLETRSIEDALKAIDIAQKRSAPPSTTEPVSHH